MYFSVVHNAWTTCRRSAKRLIMHFFCGAILLYRINEIVLAAVVAEKNLDFFVCSVYDT